MWWHARPDGGDDCFDVMPNASNTSGVRAAIGGVDTTIPAHLSILDNEDFVEGRVHTKLVEDTMDFTGIERGTSPTLPEDEELAERSMTVEVGCTVISISGCRARKSPTRGMNLSDRSEFSVRNSCMPPTRRNGSMTSAITTMPTPPIHCRMERHSNMPGGR